jgi:hypothetical protein
MPLPGRTRTGGATTPGLILRECTTEPATMTNPRRHAVISPNVRAGTRCSRPKRARGESGGAASSLMRSEARRVRMRPSRPAAGVAEPTLRSAASMAALVRGSIPESIPESIVLFILSAVIAESLLSRAEQRALCGRERCASGWKIRSCREPRQFQRWSALRPRREAALRARGPANGQ